MRLLHRAIILSKPSCNEPLFKVAKGLLHEVLAIGKDLLGRHEDTEVEAIF